MDQLMGLREELDFANASTSGFHIEAGAGFCRPAVMRANALRQSPNVLNGSIVKAGAPDERPDCSEKFLAFADIACCCARADEGCAFPCKC